MDIKNTWQHNTGTDDVLNELLRQKNFESINSKLPLHKLKSNLLIGIVLGVLITALYIYLFFRFSVWQVDIALCIVTLFNIWIIIDSLKLYCKTNAAITPYTPLKSELEKNYNSFHQWWKIQYKASLFVFPVAATGGFILGGVIGSDKTPEQFLYKPAMLIILLITIIILMPLCLKLTKWMFNYAYGRHLEKIKNLINELN